MKVCVLGTALGVYQGPDSQVWDPWVQGPIPGAWGREGEVRAPAGIWTAQSQGQSWAGNPCPQSTLLLEDPRTGSGPPTRSPSLYFVEALSTQTKSSNWEHAAHMGSQSKPVSGTSIQTKKSCRTSTPKPLHIAPFPEGGHHPSLTVGTLFSFPHRKSPT